MKSSKTNLLVATLLTLFLEFCVTHRVEVLDTRVEFDREIEMALAYEAEEAYIRAETARLNLLARREAKYLHTAAARLEDIRRARLRYAAVQNSLRRGEIEESQLVRARALRDSYAATWVYVEQDRLESRRHEPREFFASVPVAAPAPIP